MVLGDFSRAIDLLPDLVANYEAWEESRLEPDGLFWQIDDRDGMEVSIGGSGHRGQGKRATINSYMYGDALAIAAIAERAGKPEIAAAYREKAARIKRLVLEKLWDDEAKFFKVLPRGEDGRAGRRPRTARLHALVFQPAGAGQGLRGRVEATDGSEGILRALRPDDRRAAASRVRRFLRGPRVPVERSELALCHRRHPHRPGQCPERLPAAGRLPSGLLRDAEDLHEVTPAEARRRDGRALDRREPQPLHRRLDRPHAARSRGRTEPGIQARAAWNAARTTTTPPTAT